MDERIKDCFFWVGHECFVSLSLYVVVGVALYGLGSSSAIILGRLMHDQRQHGPHAS